MLQNRYHPAVRETFMQFRIICYGRSRSQIAAHRLHTKGSQMSDSQIARRHLIQGTAALAGALVAQSGQAEVEDLPVLPVDFGPCPRKLEGFLRYIVQRRAAEGLNSILVDPKDPRLGTTVGKLRYELGTRYGGSLEDNYLAWTASAAYRYPWSRFHRSEALRKRAFFLLDNIVRIRANGKWDDGGLNGFFGPHGLAWAALSWIETGDVDAQRASAWREAVSRGCDEGLVNLHYGPYRPSPLAGQYANPEMYFLAGLAAAWKLTGNGRYRDEAARALHRYDDWLFPGGGMPYILESSPQHGYQQMVVKSVALYWNLTDDPHALDVLKRLAPYFPNVQHRSGLVTDAEQPQLKHTFPNTINPGVPALIACATGDGANRYAAEAATLLTADIVDKRVPPFVKNYNWYNYQLATYAASALRLMERHPLPPAAPPSPRRVFLDGSFRGPRSHWDDFTAAVGTRQMNDSLAGAYLADPREPLMPLGAAVDGVYFEVVQETKAPGASSRKLEFRCQEWNPTVNFAAAEGFASTGCLSMLCAPYWAELPFFAGDGMPVNQLSNWTSLQHWAVWRDWLIGLGSLRCHAPGGVLSAGDAARVRWRLAPAGRELEVAERAESSLRFRYGGLQTDLTCLEQRGGFAFAPAEITEAPRAAWTPLLVRPAPWSTGDFVNVATVIRPAHAQGDVHIRALRNGAVALALEPGGRKAYMWLVNLHREMQQYLMDLPAGVTLRSYKRDFEMSSVPPGEPANAGLMGAEGALWVVQSESPLKPQALLDAVRAGKSR
jgi:hypothetical protein